MEFKELKIGMCEYIEKTITELDVINFSEISFRYKSFTFR